MEVCLLQERTQKVASNLVYSEEFSKTQAEAKFNRIDELFRKFGEIEKQNEKNRKSENPRVKDSADCLMLVMNTGIRPRSEEDTGADVKAYGATTLEGKHIVKTKEGVFLQYVGKKGVSLNIKIQDNATAAMLLKRHSECTHMGRIQRGCHQDPGICLR
jgi:DNA topoisomerase IB